MPRARPHQLGEAMRGRGPGEGPNHSALGAATDRCALRTKFRSENVMGIRECNGLEATNIPYRVAGKGCEFFDVAPKALPLLLWPG